MLLVQKKNLNTPEQKGQELGCSRGGLSSKIHVLCDTLGRPLRFFITAGQTSDYKKALDLIDGKKGKVLIADKGYDATYIIEKVKELGMKPLIPLRSNRKNQRKYNKELYKKRNLIERMFNKMKHFRRVATRYDKLATSFLSFVHIAGISLWLNFSVNTT